jgi:fucose permease
LLKIIVGWVVQYLLSRPNTAPLSKLGYVPSGAYTGVFLGRLILIEPTHHFGERPMLFLYSVACLVLQLVFWLVPNLVSSIVVFSVMGFFLGPFFAAVSNVYLTCSEV